MKKLICLLMSIVVVFTFAACRTAAATGGSETTVPTLETESLEVTSATDTAPETETTVETVPQDTQETTPVDTEDPATTTDTETQPDETVPDETVEDTVPGETEPKETEPKETEPKETEPKETEPKETEPADAQPEDNTPPATSGSSDSKEPGSCDRCDMRVVEKVEATSEKDGYVVIRCTQCGYEIINPLKYEEPEETEPTEPHQPTHPAEKIDPAEVAAYVTQYINEFRAAQGSTQLTWLPGMSNVAYYRSNQLTYNFAHDLSDMKEAAAYYKYGEWIEMADPSQSYYCTDSAEAIGWIGGTYETAEKIGLTFAEMFRDSAGHWRYVGSSEYSYIGVGVAMSKGQWYCCVMVGTVNYG